MPFVTIVVPDTKMIPHLIYHQDQQALLMRLCSDYAKPLLNNLFLSSQCIEFLDVSIEGMRQSEKTAQEVTMSDLFNGPTTSIPSMNLRTSLDYPTTGSGTRSTTCIAYYLTRQV